MPIAKVRIAPIERWCEPLRSIGADPYAGAMVEIDTKSMTHGPGVKCGGAAWKVKTLNGKPIGNWWACEHVLEMD